MDCEKMKKKAVLDFTNRTVAKTTGSKSSSPKESKADTKIKIDKAKIYAQKEIDEFKSIIQEAKTKMDKLVLFKQEAPALEFLFQTVILGELIEPVLKGNKPYGMPEENFKEVRKQMFYDLIKTYVEKEDQNKGD